MTGPSEESAGERFLPVAAPIDGYGAGGFRFGGMSHRGSILCLPSGIRVWSVTSMAGIDEAALAGVVAEANRIDLLLVGTGRDIAAFPEPLRWRLRDLHVTVDAMATAAAARTWNVLLAEDRRVAAALIAVE